MTWFLNYQNSIIMILILASLGVLNRSNMEAVSSLFSSELMFL